MAFKASFPLTFSLHGFVKFATFAIFVILQSECFGVVDKMLGIFVYSTYLRLAKGPLFSDVTNIGNREPGTGNGERGTGNGEPGTGVWELMYSGNPLENSKWRSKQKKGSKRNNLGKGEFPPAVPPDGQYVLVRAESD